jgi:hypothetical protein
MRAILRWKRVLLGGGLVLASGAALAQPATEPASTNTPAAAPGTVGPRELQNFSLSGNVTRPADEPGTPARTTAPSQSAAVPPRPSASATASPSVEAPSPARRAATAAPANQRQVTSAAPAPVSLPPAQADPVPTPTAGLSAPVQSQAVAPAAALAPEHKLPILPWLIAALAVAAGTLFLLWRRRPRHAVAGAPQIDLFVAPEAAPARPAPQPPAPEPPKPPKPPPPAANGIVATRLRPSLEIGMQPLRCVVEDDRVTLEFEIELFNAGTAPARAVLAEASLLNAGATQNEELSAFFANPVGAGERLDAIPPLTRISLASQVVAPRTAVEEYELGGRKVFVPVIAFNALYEWSGGKGQTSAAYLVGRDTNGEKLGPLRLDLGRRDVRGLAARVLPVGLNN